MAGTDKITKKDPPKDPLAAPAENASTSTKVVREKKTARLTRKLRNFSSPSSRNKPDASPKKKSESFDPKELYAGYYEKMASAKTKISENKEGGTVVTMDVSDMEGETPTSVVLPEFKNIVVDGNLVTRKVVDGKLGYYAKGSTEPLPMPKDKFVYTIPRLEDSEISEEDAIRMVREELFTSLITRSYKEASREERLQNQDMASAALQRQNYGFSGSPSQGIGSSRGGSGARIDQRDARTYPRTTVPDNFEKFDKGVATDGLAGSEALKSSKYGPLLLNEDIARKIDNWMHKYGRAFKNRDVTAQRIDNAKIKMEYVKRFRKTDISNAMKFGWSGENMKKPLMITRANKAFLFVPSREGMPIDFDDPSSFHLLRMPLSTGRGGFGNIDESNATPTGLLEVLKAEDTSPNDPGHVNFARLFLEGVQNEQNGDFIVNTNSKQRYIRCHEGRLDRPSAGCLRFGAAEVAALAALGDEGFYINVNKNGLEDSDFVDIISSPSTTV